MSQLQVRIFAPFPLDEVVAKVELAGGGHVLVLLEKGSFTGDVPGSPHKLLLTLEPASQPNVMRTASTGEIQGEPAPADIDDLFEGGVAIPAGGKLLAEVRWGAACHSDRLPAAPEGKRFASPEHVSCADWVGKEAVGSFTPLQFCGIAAQFDRSIALPVNGKNLPFGKIICLAGDFFAYLDDDALRSFPWAWPEMPGVAGWLSGDYRGHTLAADSSQAVDNLLAVIVDPKSSPDKFVDMAFDIVAHHFPARRYLALASQNFCHFACPEPGYTPATNPALRLYRAYHQRALATAATAGKAANAERVLHAALVVDAFGCHFLTDMFASGHIRVPRRLLASKYGVLCGSLKMSKDMHEEDNVRGLWVRPTVPQEKRIVWQAYGDGMLSRDESTLHREKVQEAVRRSSAEVFATYCEAITGRKHEPTPGPEELVPVPLKPGEHPSVTEQLPDGKAVPGNAVNHWPLYWFDATGEVVRRDTPAEEMNVEYSYVDRRAKPFVYEVTA